MKALDLHLDFLREARPTPRWAWALVGVGLAVLASLLIGYLGDIEPRLQATTASLARSQQLLQAKQPAPGPRMDDKQLNEEWGHAAKVAQQLNAPWGDLLDTLEVGTEMQVALLSVESDLVKKEMALTGEARHYEALMAYFRYLQGEPQLNGVTLHMHQVSRQDRDRPIRFRISAQWSTATQAPDAPVATDVGAKSSSPGVAN